LKQQFESPRDFKRMLMPEPRPRRTLEAATLTGAATGGAGRTDLSNLPECFQTAARQGAARPPSSSGSKHWPI
jgi:hypothetical protein